MRVIVTCGPSYEPVDYVRRLTNFSTGELGLMLAARLTQAEHSVVCLKGIGATAHVLSPRVEIVPFSTNDDLLWKLNGYAGKFDAIFHTAALCDYRVQSIQKPDGEHISGMGKIATRTGNLLLTLEPTTKVLPQLRDLFPKARIVGWKYELEGIRAGAVARAQDQITECRTDACVVNGAAWGEGFGFVTAGKEPEVVSDKAALCEYLINWLRNSPPRLPGPGGGAQGSSSTATGPRPPAS